MPANYVKSISKNGSNFSWAIFYFEALKDTIRGFNKWKLQIITGLLLLAVACVLAILTNILQTTSPDTIRLHSIEATRLFYHLISVVSLYQSFCTIVTLAFIPIWAFIAWLSFILTRFIVEAVFQLFYQENGEFVLRRTRFMKIVHTSLRHKLNRLMIAYLLIYTVFLVAINIRELKVSKVIEIIIISILIAIPIIFTIVWCGYYRIHQNIKHRKSCEIFLFSFSAVRRGFKTTIDVLVWLAFLGLLMLPFLFRSIDGISDFGAQRLARKHNYAINFTYLRENGLPEEGYRDNWPASIPRPELLSKNLSPIGYKLVYSELKSESLKMQHGLFLVVTFSGLLSVAFPAVSGYLLIKGRKKAILKVLIATIKTVLITCVFKVFITRAYFIDAGNPVGIAAFFMFILSLFLTLDSRKYSETR